MGRGSQVVPPPRPTSPLSFGAKTGEVRSPDGVSFMRWDGTSWQPLSVGSKAILANARARRTTNLSGQTSETLITQTSNGVVIDATHLYRISATAIIGVGTANAALQMALRYQSGATSTVSVLSSLLDISRLGALATIGLTGAYRYHIGRDLWPGDLAAGTYNFGTTAVLIAGSGTWTCYADPTYPASVLIQDMGVPGS